MKPDICFQTTGENKNKGNVPKKRRKEIVKHTEAQSMHPGNRIKNQNTNYTLTCIKSFRLS